MLVRSIKLLSSHPPRNVRLLWVVNPQKKRKKQYMCFQNVSSDSKRFFKSVTWCSPPSRISLSCPVYPGCHTQAAGLNCRESAYLSNRITRKEDGHICLSEDGGPTWGATIHDIMARIYRASSARPSHRVQQQHWCADDDIRIWPRQHKPAPH